MTKLQRIDNLIATLENQLEEIYNQMEETDDQDEIFNLDDLTTEIIRKLAELEVSRLLCFHYATLQCRSL